MIRGGAGVFKWRINGGIYNDMAGGAGARFYMAGAFISVKQGRGARFLKIAL